jgi:hypothetical protein
MSLRQIAALAVALAACSAPRTEMVVKISSNGLTIPDDIDGLTLFVRDHTADQGVYSVPPTPLCGSGSCLQLPTAITLIPGSISPHDIVEVEVQALRGSTPLIDDAATFTFADGQSQQLEFVLYRSCLHTTCAQNATMRACVGDGRCGDITPSPLGVEAGMLDDLAAPGDLPATADLATADLATADLATADLATADLASADLATPPPDLVTPPPDLTTPHDLVPPPPDLVPPPPDMVSPPSDMASSDLAQAGLMLDSFAAASMPSVSTLGWQHTVGSGTNGILLVGICDSGSGAVSAVTYAGTPMTRLAIVRPAGYPEAVVYYQLNPQSGPRLVNVMLSGTYSIATASISYFNAMQAVPTANSTSGATATPQLGIFTATGSIVVDTVCTDATATLTVNPSQNQVQNFASGGTVNDVHIGMSTKAGVAGTTTMSWMLEATHNWDIILTDLSP